MSKRKPDQRQPRVTIEGEVLRQIRQHARSNSKTEVCGVLIGKENGNGLSIRSRIPGLNAAQAGTYVTFTQDTWEHIYAVKDQKYPEERIVGWYHSHPGFGVFLSDHDTFIHKNFFGSPGQVAWVYDPHSDEEGCFGWVDGRIERLSRVTFSDERGGEPVQESGRPEPKLSAAEGLPKHKAPVEQAREEFVRRTTASEVNEETSNDSLLRLTTGIFVFLAAVLLGFLVSWYFFPRIEVVPIPVDPMTGKPLPGYSLEEQLSRSGQSRAQSPEEKSGPENQANT